MTQQPAKLTKGQRRRARIAAMTPAERQAYDEQRTLKKARSKAAKIPVSKATIRQVSITEQDSLPDVKEMTLRALRNHKSNLESGKFQDVVKATGDAYRQTNHYKNIKTLREIKVEGAAARAGIPKPKPMKEHFDRKSVKKAKNEGERRYALLWNEAIDKGLNPEDYIDAFLQREREVEQAKKAAELAANYSPEIKPKPAGRRMIMVNGVVEFLD